MSVTTLVIRVNRMLLAVAVLLGLTGWALGSTRTILLAAVTGVSAAAALTAAHRHTNYSQRSRTCPR